MLKAFKTMNHRRVLRVTLESDYLDEITLEKYGRAIDCVTISPDMYISIFKTDHYPIINIDEYFAYMDLIGIDITILSMAREESFAILVEILEAKYGIEYVDSVC